MTTQININVDKQLKNKATKILKNSGLNINTAINMFLEQVVKRNEMPFEFENPKPTKEVLQALIEVKNIRKNPDKYPYYDNKEDLKKALLDN